MTALRALALAVFLAGGSALADSIVPIACNVPGDPAVQSAACAKASGALNVFRYHVRPPN